MNPELRFWLLVAGALAGYGALLFANPVRDSLRDGLRCIRRYPTLWITLAVFGLCYALFQQVGLRLLDFYLLPEGERPIWQWTRAWFLPHTFQLEAAQRSVLPALESVAGLFNNVIATFPFSVVAALLLLINWKGHHLVLNRALRRRYGTWGWILYGIITAAAIATLAKPLVLYAGLPFLARFLPGALLLASGFTIDWLSFLFEYLFGFCIQIYLILLVYAWVRGVSFTPQHLLDFAIRRFAAVLEWAAVVLALSSALIHLPLILSTLPPFSSWVDVSTVISYVGHVARPALAIFLIFFATFQITLTFHSESLAHALRDHLRFLRRNGGGLCWFLLIAFVHFYAFHFLNNALTFGLGAGAAQGIAWQLAAPLLEAFVAAWLLASWVCFFKKCVSGHAHDSHWITF
ncbi:MAG: hypothetical protein NTZ46_11140 [Verrucomicrobia bacterium]|nr:hypothetical protein [Verrucomicrobiota bacterium]